MRVINCPVGATVIDSLQFSQSGTVEASSSLQAAGVDVVAGYLALMTKERLEGILGAGMGYIPVTLAQEYVDGAGDELFQLQALGIPKGATVFVDMEGAGAMSAPDVCIAQLTAWAAAITAHGYAAGLYVGVPQALTSDELWKLPNITRYWRGQGSIRDRFNKLAEPTGCGWCMTQMWKSQTVAGYLVDHNMVGQDYRERVPTMVVK